MTGAKAYGNGKILTIRSVIFCAHALLLLLLRGRVQSTPHPGACNEYSIRAGRGNCITQMEYFLRDISSSLSGQVRRISEVSFSRQ